MLLYMGKKCEISNTLHHIYEKVPVMNVKRLLIAACSQTLRDTLSEELSGVFQVATCDEGNDTLQLIKSYRPDILVLDLMLPGLDGVSLLRALRHGYLMWRSGSTMPAISAGIFKAFWPFWG